jgi:hypothetical protein
VDGVHPVIVAIAAAPIIRPANIMARERMSISPLPADASIPPADAIIGAAEWGINILWLRARSQFRFLSYNSRFWKIEDARAGEKIRTRYRLEIVLTVTPQAANRARVGVLPQAYDDAYAQYNHNYRQQISNLAEDTTCIIKLK